MVCSTIEQMLGKGCVSPRPAVAWKKKTLKIMAKSENYSANDEIELQLLAKLQEQPHVSQRGLAADLGVSLGSVNYCLKALMAKGFVKAENFSKSDHKLGYAYLLTPKGITAKARLTASFLKRKQAEYFRLEKEIAALSAQVKRDEAGEA